MDGRTKLLVISLLTLSSLTYVTPQDSSNEYLNTIQTAVTILQQVDNAPDELQTFLLTKMLSSIFPQPNVENVMQILQNINKGNSSIPQFNASSIFTEFLQKLISAPILKNISSTMIKEITDFFDFNKLKNVTSEKEIFSSFIEDFLRNMNRNMTLTGNDSFVMGLMNTLNMITQSMGLMSQNETSTTPTQSFPVSSACVSDLEKYRNGLISQQMWAFRMIDAMGKPSSGILDGAVNMIGDYDECVRVNADIQAPFNGKYCLVKIPVQGSDVMAAMFGGIYVGVCMPKSCSASDTENAFNSLLSKIQFGVYGTECKEEKEYDAGAIVALCICGIFIAMMIFATLIEVFFLLPKLKKCNEDKYKEKDAETQQIDEKTTQAVENKLYGDVVNGKEPPDQKTLYGDVIKNCPQLNKGFVMDENETKVNDKENMASGNDVKNNPINANGDVAKPSMIWFNYSPKPDKSDNKVKPSKYKPGLIMTLILSFSVYSNGKKILSTKQAGGTLGAINGIRFISMTWVILGHSISFGLSTMKNLGYAMPDYLSRWTFMAIANALLSVDTFFTISGLLVTYLFMKEMKKQKGKVNWFMFYFHRFWRLTPPYMLVMMINITLSKHFADGPGYPQEGLELNGRTWWRNLLYITNFFPSSEMCFGWSWYLSNDMQFYIISPLMLVPLFFWEKIGGAVVAVFLLGVTAATIGVSVDLELPVTMASLSGMNTMGYFDYYYVRPYCRMGPYLIGIITGYILYKTECKANINKIVNLFVWLIATVFACVVLYGTFEESKGNPFSVSLAALYNATHRTIWGACICWVVFSCCTGHGGLVNKFLSWKAFVPFSRLTYCAYLVHPIIMYTYFYSLRVQRYANDVVFTYDYLAHLVLSYAVAFLTSLAFESPMMGLEKAIFKRGRK